MSALGGGGGGAPAAAIWMGSLATERSGAMLPGASMAASECGGARDAEEVAEALGQVQHAH
eukprot:3282587-Rhodomonas_salina.2